jgi:hypothetical protein
VEYFLAASTDFTNYCKLCKKDQYWSWSAMILSSGILIVLGGTVMSADYSKTKHARGAD